MRRWVFLLAAAFSVSLASSAQANITVQPSRGLEFGNIAKGKDKILNFQVNNGFPLSVKVTATSDNSKFQVLGSMPVILNGNQNRTINVKFAPGNSSAGAFSGRIQLRFEPGNLAAQSLRPQLNSLNRNIPVNGIVVSITGSPGAIDFGLVNLGQSKSLTVNLRNDSPASLPPCTVQFAGQPNGDLSTSPANLTLGPNQNRTLNITFSPRNVGSSSQLLALAAIKCDPGIASIDIKGRTNVVTVSATDNVGGLPTVQVSGDPAASFGSGITCSSGGGGGTAFGGTSGGGGAGCAGVVGIGAQVTLTAPPTQGGRSFVRWTQASGSAGACNNSTAATCSFSATQNSQIQAFYQ